jgi:dTDP-4-dehydrorhamnose reductase
MDNDPYGTSKRIASDYIKLYSKNTKILKTSIVGPEQGTANGLMAWLGAQSGLVKGYTKAIWNGNTTLEWAKHAENLMEKWDAYKIEEILASESVSKFAMLHMFADYYNKQDIIIDPVELGKDKSLQGTIKTKPLEQQLEELKQYDTV